MQPPPSCRREVMGHIPQVMDEGGASLARAVLYLLIADVTV